jgi:hypothetical protein
VPTRLLLEHDHAFTPEDVKTLIKVFEDTLPQHSPAHILAAGDRTAWLGM